MSQNREFQRQNQISSNACSSLVFMCHLILSTNSKSPASPLGLQVTTRQRTMDRTRSVHILGQRCTQMLISWLRNNSDGVFLMAQGNFMTGKCCLAAAIRSFSCIFTSLCSQLTRVTMTNKILLNYADCLSSP